MKRFRLRIPGKTFVVGEYLALLGGPSVVLSTEPCFEFSWQSIHDKPSAGEIRHPFHHASPAGRWLGQLKPDPRLDGTSYVIQFHDPFLGAGGFGGSTAEFLGAWVFSRWLETQRRSTSAAAAQWQQLLAGGSMALVDVLPDRHQSVVPVWPSERIEIERFRELLRDYQAVCPEGSGADLVSQATGGLAVWDGASDEMRKFAWPFPSDVLDFRLIRTGKKLPTHLHVSEVRKRIEMGVDREFIEELRPWVEECVQSLALADVDRFAASLRGSAGALARAGWVADHTGRWLHLLSEIEGVRAAKGCGAMGSDVMLVVFEPRPEVVTQLDAFAAREGLLVDAAGSSRLMLESATLLRDHEAELQEVVL